MRRRALVATGLVVLLSGLALAAPSDGQPHDVVLTSTGSDQDLHDTEASCLNLGGRIGTWSNGQRLVCKDVL